MTLLKSAIACKVSGRPAILRYTDVFLRAARNDGSTLTSRRAGDWENVRFVVINGRDLARNERRRGRMEDMAVDCRRDAFRVGVWSASGYNRYKQRPSIGPDPIVNKI